MQCKTRDLALLLNVQVNSGSQTTYSLMDTGSSFAGVKVGAREVGDSSPSSAEFKYTELQVSSPCLDSLDTQEQFFFLCYASFLLFHSFLTFVLNFSILVSL